MKLGTAPRNSWLGPASYIPAGPYKPQGIKALGPLAHDLRLRRTSGPSNAAARQIACQEQIRARLIWSSCPRQRGPKKAPRLNAASRRRGSRPERSNRRNRWHAENLSPSSNVQFHLSPKFQLRPIPSVPKISVEKHLSPKCLKRSKNGGSKK